VDFLLVNRPTSNWDCANIKSVTRFGYSGIVDLTLLLIVVLAFNNDNYYY